TADPPAVGGHREGSSRGASLTRSDTPAGLPRSADYNRDPRSGKPCRRREGPHPPGGRRGPGGTREGGTQMFQWKCAVRAGLRLTLFACVLLTTTARAQAPAPEFVPGRVLVQFKPGTPPAREDELLAEDGGESEGEIAPIRVR